MSSVSNVMTDGGSVTAAGVQQQFADFVVPNYGRFQTVITRGEGAYVWDTDGRRYLDVGAGIAVCALGHSHPAITAAVTEQAARLMHVSNLYYHELQGRLAERLVRLVGPGKAFFCNSGAEANETLFKLARKWGHESGRFEILTCNGSFHGRTLAGISATGQDKVKQGFEPLLPGFRHVPFNSLEAIEQAISPSTVAVMIEGIQGEGGIHAADASYLTGLRALCDEKQLLLLFDGVQCGHYRTGAYQSYQRILEDVPGGESFLPDAVSMAKSLGGGFPMGAVWIRQPYADVLGPGTHGTTFGGTPLACAVGLAVLDEIETQGYDANARELGEYLTQQLLSLQERCPDAIRAVRGMGCMLGIEFIPGFSSRLDPDQAVSIQLVKALQESGMLTIPAGQAVVRFLPPLNLSRAEADEAIAILDRTIKQLTV